MSKTVIVVLALAAVVGVGYVYYSSTNNTGQKVKNFGAKGKKQNGNFQNNGIQIGNKAGLNANVNVPGAGDWGSLINGIFHPTNGNGATATAASQTSTSTTTQG